MPHLLPKAAEQNSAGKQKKQARIFQTRKYEVHIFSRRHLCFRLGRPAAQSPTLPGRLHIPFRRQPANTSRHHSFHTGPHNPQSANSLPSGLAGRRLTFLPTTFLTSTKCHLPQHPPDASPPSLHHHSVLPHIFLFLSIFYVSANIIPAFAFPYLQLQSHPTTFQTPSTSSVLLPLL